jgi:HPt (histidine-containing phosphotransfer) domain-containing protein
MDGIETAQRIRGLGSGYAVTVPIIALTANAIAGNERLFLDSEFQAFISKPVSLTKLDAAIRKWVMKEDGPAEPVFIHEDTPPHGETIEIPGVDAVMGLDLFEGDREMFIDFLRSYAEGIPKVLSNLRHVAAPSLPEYAIHIHTVKGASAGIGADGLAARAKRLQLMAKAGDLQGVLSDNPAFLREADALVADINAWLSANA